MSHKHTQTKGRIVYSFCPRIASRCLKRCIYYTNKVHHLSRCIWGGWCLLVSQGFASLTIAYMRVFHLKCCPQLTSGCCRWSRLSMSRMCIRWERVPVCHGQCVGGCIGMHVCFCRGYQITGPFDKVWRAHISCDIRGTSVRNIIPQFDTLCAPMGVLLQTTCFYCILLHLPNSLCYEYCMVRNMALWTSAFTLKLIYAPWDQRACSFSNYKLLSCGVWLYSRLRS